MVILFGIPMGKLITVSAKVSEELKKRAEELGINISALVRKALEAEIKKIELQSALKNLREEIERSPSLPEGIVVRIIRETREGRKLVE
ncbi:type II toxin-antitoxin system CcdA family antitoxin [Candidatus Bathyarchaeota archaeon]|nr:type II toxin-antitoxin system CcdA family antitoxin [Candidatus Bathyarchaeota archaeon]